MIEINELFNEIITFDIPFICLLYISKGNIVHFYRKYTRTVCMHISISTKAIHATSYYIHNINDKRQKITYISF